MGKIDILRLQDNGFIETTNGTIKFGMSLNDLTQILGDVKYIFDYQGLNHEIKDIIMSMPGKHNVENACVAISVALINGVAHENIKEALAGFKGIQRRFERIIVSKDLVFIDDYAHHPGELKVAIDNTYQP